VSNFDAPRAKSASHGRSWLAAVENIGEGDISFSSVNRAEWTALTLCSFSCPRLLPLLQVAWFRMSDIEGLSPSLNELRIPASLASVVVTDRSEGTGGGSAAGSVDDGVHIPLEEANGRKGSGCFSSFGLYSPDMI
jgi:hypothetical protein